MPLTQSNFVAYYSMDEASLATRVDKVAANNAANNGVVNAEAAVVNNGARFDANVANFLNAPDQTYLSPLVANSPFWVAFLCVMRADTTGSAVAKFGGPAGSQEWYTGPVTAGAWTAWFYNGVGVQTAPIAGASAALGFGANWASGNSFAAFMRIAQNGANTELSCELWNIGGAAPAVSSALTSFVNTLNRDTPGELWFGKALASSNCVVDECGITNGYEWTTADKAKFAGGTGWESWGVNRRRKFYRRLRGQD